LKQKTEGERERGQLKQRWAVRKQHPANRLAAASSKIESGKKPVEGEHVDEQDAELSDTVDIGDK
jgi:hypothetical protein